MASNIPEEFKEIAPYSDDEVPGAISRLINNDLLPIALHRINPNKDVETFKKELTKIRSINEFQQKFTRPTVERVIATTTEGLTVEGLAQLKPDKSYLFIANHRDIALDAAVLGVELLKNGYRMPEISFGDNLVANTWVDEVSRLNRMFQVKRTGTARELYEYSALMSRYIRYVLSEKQHSVWIAQRGGRTKDGNDHTEIGILKMLSMSGKGSFVEDMEALNIVPVAISYEYEPCAWNKAKEMRIMQSGYAYQKHNGEDLISVMEGIWQQKGNVTLSFCAPITHEELVYCATAAYNIGAEHIKNAPFNALTQIIDRRIYSNYKIYNINKLAYEIMSGQASPDICITAKNLFYNDNIIKIYANPVYNKLAVLGTNDLSLL